MIKIWPNKICYPLLLSFLVISLIPSLTQAVVAPYYAYGDAYTRHNIPTDFSLIEANTTENDGSLYVNAGGNWWCDTPNCGISIVAGANTAYSEVSADPTNGTLNARAGSFAYDQYGGYARTYGYISQVFQVGTDGSLSFGDTVNLDIGMLLGGTIDSHSQSAQVGGLVTVNHYDPASSYDDGLGNPLDYMPVSTFEDLLFSPDILDAMPAHVSFYGNQMTTNNVDFNGTDSFNAAVGDILVVESMLYLTNALGYSDDIGESWTDFDNTMSSSLTTTTLGATISAVPLPPALYLFASGLALMLFRRRRK
ncbi:MAG: hypothetical protein OQL06_10700 [Gammaproteobacteria bacterium]|nr:hypothetical protein [Gammaproteobacteria bacterium]